jgi:hypothetical protein
MELLLEVWQDFKVRKKFWLLPIIMVMLLLGVLIVISEGSAVAYLFVRSAELRVCIF